MKIGEPLDAETRRTNKVYGWTIETDNYDRHAARSLYTDEGEFLGKCATAEEAQAVLREHKKEVISAIRITKQRET